MIITNKNKNFWEIFQKMQPSDAWHCAELSKDGVNFNKQLAKDGSYKIEDQSFIFMRDNDPLIAFIGSMVEKNGNKDLLCPQIPCYVLDNKSNFTKNATKSIIKHFDQILDKINGKVILRDYQVDSEISLLSKHMLSLGATSQLVFRSVIDLSISSETLKSNVRKSYGSLINYGLKELDPKIIDSKTIEWKMFEEFKALHLREAGRETRSNESWIRQYEAVKNDNAFLVLGYSNAELVSAGFFQTWRSNCYYGSSASRRDLFEKPIFHGLMWTAITHAKAIGCRWLDTGDQVYPNQPFTKKPSDKELGISNFKSGFGGKVRCCIDFSIDM